MAHAWKYFYAFWAILGYFLGPIALLFPPVLMALLFVTGFLIIPLVHEGYTEWRARMARISQINDAFDKTRKESKDFRIKSGSYKRMQAMKKM